MFKDKELRKALKDSGIFVNESCGQITLGFQRLISGNEIQQLHKALHTQKIRISELEAKLEAALGLLNIKHEPARNEPAKLVKGNKSAVIAGVLNNGSTDITLSEQDADVIKRRREEAHAIYNRNLFNMAAGMNTCVRDGD